MTSEVSSRLLNLISDPDLYYDLVGRTNVAVYCTLSAVVIFFWDWAINLGDEVELVWMQDWSLAGKPLYLFLRYGGFSFQMYDLISMLGSWNQQFCTAYFWTIPWGTAVLLYVVDILLAYRVVCLYNCNRNLMIANILILIVCMTASIVILRYALPLYAAIATPEHLTGCWAWMPSWAFASTAPPIIFELWIFALVLWRIYVYYKEFDMMPKMNIMRLLIKDQMIWFVIIAAAILWNLLQLILAPLGLRGLAIPYFRSAVCICGCHLVLHIRAAYFSSPQPQNQSGNSADNGNGMRHLVNVYAPKMGLPPPTKKLQSLWFDSDSENEHDRTHPRPRTKSIIRRVRRSVRRPSRDLGLAVVVAVAQETAIHFDDGLEEQYIYGNRVEGLDSSLDATRGVEMEYWRENWSLPSAPESECAL